MYRVREMVRFFKHFKPIVQTNVDICEQLTVGGHCDSEEATRCFSGWVLQNLAHDQTLEKCLDEKAKCKFDWEHLSDKEQAVLSERYKTSKFNLQRSFNKLWQDAREKLMAAHHEHQGRKAALRGDYRAAARRVSKEFSCDGDCMSKCGEQNDAACFENCQCANHTLSIKEPNINAYQIMKREIIDADDLEAEEIGEINSFLSQFQVKEKVDENILKPGQTEPEQQQLPPRLEATKHMPKPEKLADEEPWPYKPYNVHIIPHSHDDVGWLKTVDEYFYGTLNRRVQWTSVSATITSVVEALLADRKRKFSQVEMKFMAMWWNEQTDELKDKVRGLVEDGQLELVNGGWTMHDEACATHEDMIENMALGHSFIQDNFNVSPRIGWSIDPFGHSSTNARLFAEMGFDAVFFARADYQDKKKRVHQESLEYVWRPSSDSLGTDVEIFTHILWDHYNRPAGFGFDVLDYEEEGVWHAENAQKLMAVIDERARHYRTDEILVLFGDDFQYMQADQNFAQMDNMIEYMNSKHGNKYNFMYSTPSQYIDAINRYNVTWPTKYDDGFPYSDKANSYWTGYFTSRPNFKQYVRRAS